MIRTLLKSIAGALALVIISAAPGWCTAFTPPSVTLLSNGGGTYTYGINFPSAFTFFTGDTVNLSLMNGVTGETLTSTLPIAGFAPNGTTPSTASIILPTGIGSAGFGAGLTGVGNLNVFSTILTTGTIDWSIVGPNGTEEGSYDFTGTTTGPVGDGVTSTPEPGSAILLLCGLVGLALMATRRNSTRSQTAA